MTAKNIFANRIKKYVDAEIETAVTFLNKDELASAFRHLERAHIVGQAVTIEHTRVHWLMLKVGWKRRDLREICGQVFRILGASTKTPLGIYPPGNTGGANISPFKPLPVPKDLAAKIERARNDAPRS
jgi:hypothetical protein